MRTSIHFNINGQDFHLNNPDPELSLAFYLRQTVGLIGCKIGCEEGTCGSCTVVIAEYSKPRPIYKAVNACLYPLYQVDGKFVITVEGIGNKSKIHEIQKRLARGHGTQCGFCSPGFVMSMYALLMETDWTPTVEQINQAIKGNLCRCTGYRPIFEAFYTFAGDGCCKGQGGQGGCPCKENADPQLQIENVEFPLLDKTQNLIFPASLIENQPKSGLLLESERVSVAIPSSIEEFNEIWRQHQQRTEGSELKFVSSGIITRFGSFYKPEVRAQWICISRIPEYRKVEVHQSHIEIGSGLSLRELFECVTTYCDTEITNAFRKMFKNYSSHQVFNVASWAGALCGKAIGDIEVLCRALGVDIHMKHNEKEEWTSTEDSGKLKRLISEGYLIERMRFPRHLAGKMFAGKFGERPGPDTTIINYALVMIGSENISNSRLIVSDRSTVIELKELQSAMKDKSYEDVMRNPSLFIEKSKREVEERLGTAKWLLVRGVLIKSFKSLNTSLIPEKALLERITSTQLFTNENENNARIDSVGSPIPHISAELAATGEAVFNGDIRLQDMVHLSFVLSKIPKGKVLSIDSTRALAIPGVLAFYDYNDIPVNGKNNCGILPVNGVYDDTPILANGEVEYVGQPIGVVVATTVEVARRASQCVEVAYKEAEATINMKDAIEKKEWLGRVHEYGKTAEQVEEEMKNCEVKIEGEISLDGQQHIYMETQTAVAYVGDHNEVIVHASTQSLSNVQQMTAAFLGLPSNKVIVKVKRLGGGFGGKATQSVPPACLASLVALKLKRPASCVYSREEDFLITGGRHPGYWKYRLGGDMNGKLKCLDLKVYLDAGAYLDMSEWVMFVACGTGSDASYLIPCMRSEGYVVKTNKTSHTAMRGFGKPQATYAMECILRHYSFEIKKECDEIKEINFNGKGFRTHFGTLIHSDSLLDVYNELKQFSKYDELKKEVEQFNSQHTTEKRGISLSTVRFGLTQGGHMEQTTALVQIYLDGSVAISIGGIEMGQGLSTKIQQVASRALNIPIDFITVLCGSTDKTANAPETGGSQGADLHGRAVQIACARLMEQIDPLREKKSEMSWPEIALEAYKQQLPLQATENIKINRKKYGIEENSPTYFTTGAACVVLELDCLTGDHVVRNVDIVMDVGKSLNPALDIGQIEGAFVQGYGQFVSESLPYDSETGRPLLDSIAKYKAPTPYMVPRQFRVKLMKDGPGFPEQVYSSKGIGEPPIMLSIACYSALLDAVNAFLSDKKESTKFIQHNAPLTRCKLLEILHEGSRG